MTAAPVAAPPRSAPVLFLLRILGAGLLLGIAVIHGYLWRQGYRDIDTIGPAFLLQTTVGVLGAVAVLLAPRRLLPWAAAAGAFFAVGSLVALLLATTTGLFGFVETTAAQLWWESLWVEGGAVVVLATLAVLAWAGRRR